MDNILKDTAELLDLIEKKLSTFEARLCESDVDYLWADFDDCFRGVRRELASKTLRIDELIRWD